MKNGVEFRIVTLAGVIVECSSVAQKAIGRDLIWLKKELHKAETYSAVEVEKPIPLWLQHKEFDGEWDKDEKWLGIVIEEVEKPTVITNPTKLPNIKGVKFT